MWLLYFVNGLNSSLTANLSAYITSDFSEHSLLTVISVVTSVMGENSWRTTMVIVFDFSRILTTFRRCLCDANRKGVEPVGPNPRNLHHGFDCYYGPHYDGVLQQYRNLLRCAGKSPSIQSYLPEHR